MEDVLIKIGASARAFTEEMDRVEKKTEDTREVLGKMTVAASAGFLAFTGTIAACVAAFNEQEQADLKLNAVLQSTGGIAGMTAESVGQLAKELERTTGFSEDNIKAAEGVMLRYTNIGQNVFPQATKAILDFAAGTGIDATAAADALGKALNEPEQGMLRLSRQGVTFTEVQKAQVKAMQLAGDTAGAQKIILDALTVSYGGQSEAAAQGAGQLRKLREQLGELLEDVGQHLAPTINAAAGALARFIAQIREHEEVAKLAAAVLTAGAAVTGIAAAAGAGALAFLKLQAALAAAKVSIDLTALSVRALVGATGIGLIVIAVAELAMHWDTVWPAMQRVFFGFVNVVSNAAGGLGKILFGALVKLDLNMIKDGWAQVSRAYQEGAAKVATTATQAQRAAANDRAAQTRAAIAAEKALQDEKGRYELASVRANNQALVMEYQGASKRLIALKTEEGKLLKQIADATGNAQLASVRAAAQKQLAEVRRLQEDARKDEQAREKRFQQIETRNAAQYHRLSLANQRRFDAEKRRELMAELKTEEDAEREFYEKELERQVQSQNDFLANQVKFGTAYAQINQIMHSAILQGTGSAFDQMAAMTQSHNAVLKTAGQVAASAQIAMKTAQAAMEVYAGFQSLPFGLGIPLGIAAAGLVIGFGAEQEADVWAAAEGGVMAGGIPGKDSIRTLTMPGELITPTANFEEVIGSVAAQRAAEEAEARRARAAGPVQKVEVGLKVTAGDEWAKKLVIQQNKNSALGKSTWTDILVRR